MDNREIKLPKFLVKDIRDEVFDRGKWVGVVPMTEDKKSVLLFKAKDDYGNWFWSIPSGNGPLKDGKKVNDAASIELEHDMHIEYPVKRVGMFGDGAIFEVVLPPNENGKPKKEGRNEPTWFSRDTLPRAEEFIHDQFDLIDQMLLK